MSSEGAESKVVQLIAEGVRKIPKSHVSRVDRRGLRAICQESVHDFTASRREEYRQRWRDGWRCNQYFEWKAPDWEHPETVVLGEEIPPALLDRLQPSVENYDPVVQLAMMSVDMEIPVNIRRMALGEAAMYVRPRLKAVALMDMRDEATQEVERQEAMNSIASALDVLARARRDAKKVDSNPEVQLEAEEEAEQEPTIIDDVLRSEILDDEAEEAEDRARYRTGEYELSGVPGGDDD